MLIYWRVNHPAIGSIGCPHISGLSGNGVYPKNLTIFCGDSFWIFPWDLRILLKFNYFQTNPHFRKPTGAENLPAFGGEFHGSSGPRMRPTPFAALLAHTAAAAEYVAPVLLMQLGEADGSLPQPFSGRSGPSIWWFSHKNYVFPIKMVIFHHIPSTIANLGLSENVGFIFPINYSHFS